MTWDDPPLEAVIDARVAMALVPARQQVELSPLRRGGDARVFDVLDQLAELLVAGIDIGPLEGARQEGRLPVLTVLDGQAVGTHGDEAGEILVFGAEAVVDPGAGGGSDKRVGTGVQFQ